MSRCDAAETMKIPGSAGIPACGVPARTD